MKHNRLAWPQLTYSHSVSAYIIGIFSGIRAYDHPEDIPFYMLGALVVSITTTFIIALKSDTETHNWNEAYKEGVTYFIRYIMTLLGAFVVTAILAKLLFPFF